MLGAERVAREVYRHAEGLVSALPSSFLTAVDALCREAVVTDRCPGASGDGDDCG